MKKTEHKVGDRIHHEKYGTTNRRMIMKKTEHKVGDRIHHEKYGHVHVMEVDEDGNPTKLRGYGDTQWGDIDLTKDEEGEDTHEDEGAEDEDL